jgi:hypothetical protein
MEATVRPPRQTSARWFVVGRESVAGAQARPVGAVARGCWDLPARLKLLGSALKVSVLLQVSRVRTGPDLSLAGS